MHVEVKPVPEDTGSAVAVAQFKDDLKAKSFIVMSGDLVTDVPLKVMSANAQLNLMRSPIKSLAVLVVSINCYTLRNNIYEQATMGSCAPCTLLDICECDDGA